MLAAGDLNGWRWYSCPGRSGWFSPRKYWSEAVSGDDAGLCGWFFVGRPPAILLGTEVLKASGHDVHFFVFQLVRDGKYLLVPSLYF